MLTVYDIIKHEFKGFSVVTLGIIGQNIQGFLLVNFHLGNRIV